MHRLLTPLLRRIYALFGAFVVLYLGFSLFEYSSWNKERLYGKLLSGGEAARNSAGFDLAYLKGEKQLMRALKTGSPEVRSVAMSSLWELWARAAGTKAFRRVQEANRAVERKAYTEALELLTQLIQDHPRFAEGWNRRATVYWELGRWEESVADAQQVVRLNPNHFGAWQGLGLCYASLGDLREACRCIREALRINPHDPALHSFLKRCEEMLHWLSPAERIRYDLI